MNEPSGISRRTQHCLERLRERDCEGALVNLFPAIDKTAKKRRPKANVGERIRAFLQDEEILISAIGTRNIITNFNYDGLTLHDVMYKFGRTSIAHEGELDPRLTFNSDLGLQIGRDGWNLPVGYIVGMSIAVIIAPENIGERTAEGLVIEILGGRFVLNDIWGRPEPVHRHISTKFGLPYLFQK
ncbi:hypothetical protein MXE95_02915 [Aeromonas caviae]|uniref:hypothetical protein n=1 Tax=Aeromonas caviae TaxID=648 RepID=UPI002DBC4A0F|nr:hypothetical protein [Aeromonas caviae]MEB5773065.1 hypothetical protein [Aeromonas caviae]MEB6648390.1 hypothetical protein [Aeromonas caviae]